MKEHGIPLERVSMKGLAVKLRTMQSGETCSVREQVKGFKGVSG